MSDYHVDRSSRPAEMSRGGNARPGPGCRVPTCRGSDWMEKQRQEQGDRTAEWKACKQWLTLRAGLAREEGKEGEEGSQKLVQSVCVWRVRERERARERETWECAATDNQASVRKSRQAQDLTLPLIDTDTHTNIYNYRRSLQLYVEQTNPLLHSYTHHLPTMHHKLAYTHTHTHTEIQ